MELVKINILNPETNASRDICAKFTTTELNLFEAFISNTQRLNDSRLVKSGMPASFKMSFNQSSGTSYEANLPDEEDFLSFLHKIRMFILTREPASYDRVTGIIARRFNDKDISSMIKVKRKMYDGRNFQGMVKITSNESIINSEEVLFDWLNSFEYHSDTEKKEKIDSLHKIMPLETSKAFFLILLSDKLVAINEIANFIELLLGKLNRLEAHA